MTTMTPQLVVPILGSFGDGKAYAREETYPMLGLMYKKFKPEFIESVVRRYLEYGLLRTRYDGTIEGHKYLQITKKGGECLDYYRNLHHRDPEEGVLF